MQQNHNIDMQLWNDYKQKFRSAHMQMLKSKSLSLNGRVMNFVYKQIGNRPPNGFTLIFGFHGGGQCPPQTNDQQYNNHKSLYDRYLPNGTIWFTPRSIQNKSDMWHRQYMQDFILQIIRAFASNDIIDVNKVFLTGYSAGGDGIYHMAPRMADFLAGAAMMAGHPNGINLYNIRNIGFSIHVGGQDNSYNRNLQAVKYMRMLNQLGQNYGGFKHQSKIHEGKPHWMAHQQAQIFGWLFALARNPYPNLILYRQCKKKLTFYYLRLGQSRTNNPQEQVVVIKQGNNFRIISNRIITIMVNSKMINVNQPIKIIHNGKVTNQRMFQPRKQICQKTFFERFDPYYIFQDELQSVPNDNIDVKKAICQQFQLDPTEKEAQYEGQLGFSPENVPSSFNRNINPPPKKYQKLNHQNINQMEQIYSSGHEQIQRNKNNSNFTGQGVMIGSENQQHRLANQRTYNPYDNQYSNQNPNQPGKQQARNPSRCADDCCTIF